MKRIVAMTAAFACVLAAAGCGETEDAAEVVTEEETIAEYIPTESEAKTQILAYITEFDGYAAVLDEVELAEVPSERAAELKMDDEDAPDGLFYIDNSDLTQERFELAEDCAIAIIIQVVSGVYDLRSITAEDFAEVMREQGEQERAPYAIEISNGKIVSITERYVQ